MPLRYVDYKPLELQSLYNMPLIERSLQRSQNRYDTASLAQENALQEALSRGFIDEKAREDYLNKARGRFDEVAQQYRGDLSAGYKDVLGAITGVKTDPYIQANQAQLDAYKQQQAVMTQMGQYGYLKNDIASESLIDPETGKYRTTFQPQVYDLRELGKQASVVGSSVAARKVGEWQAAKGLPGMKERLQGFRNEEEALNFLEDEGQTYITDIIESQGLDPTDERLRQLTTQGMLPSLVGKMQQEVDRSYASPLDLDKFELSKDRFQLAKDKFEADTKLKQAKAEYAKLKATAEGRKSAAIKTYGTVIERENEKVNKTLDIVNNFTSWKPVTEKAILGADPRARGTTELVKNDPSKFVNDYEKELDRLKRFHNYVPPRETQQLLDKKGKVQQVISMIESKGETAQWNLNELEYISKVTGISPTEINYITSEEDVEKFIKDKVKPIISQLNSMVIPQIQEDLKEFEIGMQNVQELNKGDVAIPEITLNKTFVRNRFKDYEGADKGGTINPVNGDITVGTTTISFNKYQNNITPYQKLLIESGMDIFSSIYSTNNVYEEFITPDKDKITLSLTDGLTEERGKKRGKIYRQEAIGMNDNGTIRYSTKEETTVDELLDDLFNDVLASTIQPVDVGKKTVKENTIIN